MKSNAIFEYLEKIHKNKLKNLSSGMTDFFNCSCAVEPYQFKMQHRSAAQPSCSSPCKSSLNFKGVMQRRKGVINLPKIICGWTLRWLIFGPTVTMYKPTLGHSLHRLFYSTRQKKSPLHSNCWIWLDNFSISLKILYTKNMESKIFRPKTLILRKILETF
jgi:hypothetical protein